MMAERSEMEMMEPRQLFSCETVMVIGSIL